MDQKELILQLIQQDLKHHQLIHGLRQLGLQDDGLYNLNILPIVARLMGVPEGEIAEEWAAIYLDSMERALDVGVSALGKELRAVAEGCYAGLVGHWQ